MVGGRIVSIEDQGDRLRVIVANQPHGWHEYCGVDIGKTGYPLRLGDWLWWQCENCYWTPADRSVEDVPICKIGYSFSTGLTR